MRQLITPSGDIVDAQDGIFGHWLDGRVSAPAIPGFLVRNWGFAGIAVKPDAIAIYIAPARVQLDAIARLSRLLADVVPRRVILAWHGSVWAYEFYSSADSVLDRIGHLMRGQLSDGGPQKYIAQPRDIESLPSGHAFCGLLDQWRENCGKITIADQGDLLFGQLKGRFALIREDDGSGKLVFEELGAGLKMYHSGWTRRFVGVDVEDQPDIAYGRAVANCWRGTLLTAEPQLADVDAQVFDPKTQTCERRRYVRLALPVPSSSGRSLLSATCLDSRVNLRLQLKQ